MPPSLPHELIEAIVDEVCPLAELPWTSRIRQLLGMSTVSRQFCEITQRLALIDVAFDTPEGLDAYLDKVADSEIDAKAAHSVSFSLRSDGLHEEYDTMVHDSSAQALACCPYRAELDEQVAASIGEEVRQDVETAVVDSGWPVEAERELQEQYGRLMWRALDQCSNKALIRFSDLELVYHSAATTLDCERVLVHDYNWIDEIVDEERADREEVDAFFGEVIDQSEAIKSVTLAPDEEATSPAVPPEHLASMTVCNRFTPLVFQTGLLAEPKAVRHLTVILPHRDGPGGHAARTAFVRLVTGMTGELTPLLRSLSFDPVAHCCYAERLDGVLRHTAPTVERIHLKLDPGNSPQPSQLRDLFPRWCDDVYHGRQQASLRRIDLVVPQVSFGSADMMSDPTIRTFRALCGARRIQCSITAC